MLITTTKLLEEFCSQIKQEKMVAIDTEFSRDTTYYPKLCLIQVASINRAAAIDVLCEEIDLSALISILKDPKIIKIFHSARQDLESLLVFFKFLPNNIFDTQIAASFCGYGASVSYEFLVNEFFSYKLDKSLRISDWTHRPLSSEQIDYALADVNFILKIYDQLYKKLIANNLYDWALEDMRELNQLEKFDKNIDQAWQKIKYSHNLKIDLVLKKLSSWRELKAQELNLPRNHFLNEKNLIKLAKVKPITLEEIQAIEGFKNFSLVYCNEITNIILKALEEEIYIDINDNKQKQSENKNYYQELNNSLILCAKKHNIENEIIASKQEIKDFLKNGKARFLRGWRYEVFGKKAQQILNKN